MEINSIQNYYRMQTAASTASAKKAPVEENTTSITEGRTTDTIEISSEASFKSELNTYTKACAAKNTEEVSADRIAELKQKYQGDSCPIASSDIASSIISGILGPGINA